MGPEKADFHHDLEAFDHVHGEQSLLASIARFSDALLLAPGVIVRRHAI